MRARVVLLPILLASCQDRGSSPVPSPTPNFSRDPATGEIRARVALSGGAAAELRSGATVPVVLPPGFTIYPGAKVLRNTRVDRGEARQVLVEFATPDSIAEVLHFHRAQAEAAGVELALDLEGRNAASIGGRTATGGDFALTARRESGITIVELSIGDAAGAGSR